MSGTPKPPPNISHTSDMDVETSCGLFSWRPTWLQRFADSRVYVAIYFVIGMLQSVVFSYLSVVLSTIEKRFGLQSRETAWLYSGNEISQICFIAFLPFVGRAKKRPLYLGLSMMLSALGMYLISMPHFFGSDLGRNVIVPSPTSNSSSGSNSEGDLCDASRELACNNEEGFKDYGSLVVIFMGIFLVGIGISFFYSFGIPYVDDNSGKGDSPFYLSVVTTARSIGPTLGYVLGGSLLAVHVDLTDAPDDIDQDDPRWIGAWWLGFIIIGTLVFVLSPLLTLFPERLPAKNNTDAKLAEKERGENPRNVKEWLEELKLVSVRLLTNKIWMLNLASTAVFLFGVIGFMGFLPKYLEYHFRQRASVSGSSGGLINAFSSAIGMLVSGYLIGKYKPRAKFMAGLCVLGSFAAFLAFATLSMTKCPSLHIDGPLGSASLVPESLAIYGGCSLNCNCDEVAYHPVCSRDGVSVFFSPCHAGCKLANYTEDLSGGGRTKRNLYWDCSCIKKLSEHNEISPAEPWWTKENKDERPLPPLTPSLPLDSAIDGYCPFDCSGPFYTLLGVLFIMSLIGAATRVPNMLISLRAISAADKAASFTLTISLLSIFTFLPAPVIYGYLVDSACKVWGDKCGKRTNCLVYDTDALRLTLGITSSVLMLFTVAFDAAIWYYIGDLKLYDDDEEGVDKKGEKVNEKSAKDNGGFRHEREDSGIEDSPSLSGDGMVEIELGNVGQQQNGSDEEHCKA